MSRGRRASEGQSIDGVVYRLGKPLREVANIAEVIIAEQRMGPIGVERLSFNPELTRFTDL
jgi:replicative DNA helicase